MLEKIIKKHYDEIFRYCYHHVNSFSEAEDLCQDTFLSFIEHYGQYRNIGKTKNYLYTIAGNKCKDYYKKQRPLVMEVVPFKETGERIEDMAVLKHMVMCLPEEFKEAVVLRYFQNLKYGDMAAILKISTSLAKYRVKKGVELLAEMEGGSNGTKRN
ncbi:ECF RNA polymerase sigma factor SigE [Lachnospiraceae bacterium]|nr:ECF RNA polymerase sigma factor SigE [Lachnospiraceae bacterium]